MATPSFEIPAEWSAVATAIHSSGRKIVIAVTGGGSGAISALLQTPGASRTILEAIVPYSHAALTDWIGAKPEQACSAATARAMAMAAFMRARELAPDAAPETWLGVGATASLATDRPKRGERRGHLAFQTHDRAFERHYSLDDSPPDRGADEQIAAAQTLAIVLKGCGLSDADAELHGGASGHGVLVADEATDLLLGRKRLNLCGPGSWWDYLDDSAASTIRLLFPGAFNPPHVGHLRMAEAAEKRLRCPVVWELSIENVDKPLLDLISIEERFEWLRELDDDRWIALTRAPTFREKSELFPNATFIVGIDTLVRIADPKYYGGDPSQRDAAIAEIASRGCRFLAFGRVIDGKFTVLSDLMLPPALAAICDEVPAAEFREDVSSTELRNGLANS
ncbi:MAG: hypothetical protein C0485_06610 [Pirellula sp.]|nr:hypothetical protein [Pirellula sp.]